MEDWLKQAAHWMQLGLLGMFGGAAAYVYNITEKGRRFSWLGFVGNLFLAFFVGRMAGDWIPGDGALGPYKDGIVMALGFCAYPILRLVESRFPQWFAARVLK